MFWKLLSAALLAAALAFAQRGGAGRGMDEDTGGGRAMPPRRPSKLDQLAGKLRLNADRKAEARTIVMDVARQTGPLQQQLTQARQNLAGALIAGNSEQAGQALAQYTPLAAQLAAVEAKSFAKNPKDHPSDQLIPPGETHQYADNTALMGEAAGLGSADLSKIDVRGVPIKDAVYDYEAHWKGQAPV